MLRDTFYTIILKHKHTDTEVNNQLLSQPRGGSLLASLSLIPCAEKGYAGGVRPHTHTHHHTRGKDGNIAIRADKR